MHQAFAERGSSYVRLAVFAQPAHPTACAPNEAIAVVLYLVQPAAGPVGGRRARSVYPISARRYPKLGTPTPGGHRHSEGPAYRLSITHKYLTLLDDLGVNS